MFEIGNRIPVINKIWPLTKPMITVVTFISGETGKQSCSDSLAQQTFRSVQVIGADRLASDSDRVKGRYLCALHGCVSLAAVFIEEILAKMEYENLDLCFCDTEDAASGTVCRTEDALREGRFPAAYVFRISVFRTASAKTGMESWDETLVLLMRKVREDSIRTGVMREPLVKTVPQDRGTAADPMTPPGAVSSPRHIFRKNINMVRHFFYNG